MTIVIFLVYFLKLQEDINQLFFLHTVYNKSDNFVLNCKDSEGWSVVKCAIKKALKQLKFSRTI